MVLKQAQSLSAATGRSFGAGGAPTCTDVPAPAGAAGRRLLQLTQAVLTVPVSSVGPVTSASNEAEAIRVAEAVQASVQEVLVQVVQAAVADPGFDAAATAQQMKTELSQINLEGQELLKSPPPSPAAKDMPPPVGKSVQPPSLNPPPTTQPTTSSPPPR